MTPRQAEELQLLQDRYPSVESKQAGELWILVPQFVVTQGWQEKAYDICFPIGPGYPERKPYAFYAKPYPRWNDGRSPTNYEEGGSPQPPFDGPWGKFSWDNPEWHAHPEIHTGDNMITWVESFRNRFREGP